MGIRALLTLLVALLSLTAAGISGISLINLARQENDGAIINIAGRQRMLTQKMSKEALAVASGNNGDAARQLLQKTHLLFTSSHKGLLNGNSAMGLPPLTDPAILAQMQKVDTLWQPFGTAIATIIGGQPAAGPFREALSVVMTTNDQLLTEMNKGVTMFEAAAGRKIARLKTILYAGILLALIVAAGCVFFINARIITPIGKIVASINDLGEGKLGTRLHFARQDELGMIAGALDGVAENMEQEIVTAFERLADGDFTFSATGVIREPLARANRSLNETMEQIRNVSLTISQRSDSMADTSQTLSQSATESAASLEEIAASMTELNSQTRHNAANAKEANKLAETAMAVAERGNNQMTEMKQAMAEITAAADSISKIIKVIDEIAFQTNLLALNAAVEAARAGQHGKGFAVVAEEVRNLAARSAKAAQETSHLIESSVNKTRKGDEISSRTAEALEEIVGSVNKVNDLVAEITASSEEQAQGIEQVNLGLSQIDQATQLNTASSEEAASSAVELAQEATTLRERLARFTLASHTFSSLSTPDTPMIAPDDSGATDSGRKLIPWTRDLSVDIRHIDKQHRTLIDIINDLHQALTQARAGNVIQEIIDRLLDYTVNHFGEEERLMERHGYPKLAQHKEIHKKFIATAQSFQERINQGAPMSAVAGELLATLRDWLVNHIKKTDRQYAAHLHKKGVH